MKTAKIIFVIVICLFLFACKSEEAGEITTNYKEGYGNLQISTIENNPPKELYQDSEFKIIVQLENKGAYPLINGKLKILGFDSHYIHFDQTEQEIKALDGDLSLEGRNILNPAGETTLITFDGKTKQLFPGAETYPAPYFIQADYDYKTELIHTACINPRFYDIYDSGCKVTPKQTLGGQGSPLAITSIEEIITPGAIPSVEFRLKIENKGKGKIKKATIVKSTLSNEEIDCEFNNNQKSYDFKEKKEVTIICKKGLKDQRSYESVLLVDIDFSYSLKEKKTLTLKK